MRTYLIGAALAATLLACGSAPGDGGRPARTGARVGHDFVFFGESRPVLVRAYVELDGKPLAAVWDDYMGQVFTYLDVNGDGVLSKQEAERAPLPQILLSGGGPFFGPPAVAQGPTLAALDANRDGQVTRQELADYYRKNGAPPFQFRMGRNDNTMGGRVRLLGMAQTGTPSADALNERLFELLDTNKDGKLSGKELAAAPGLLMKRDADDDETVSVDEIMPTRAMGGGNGFVVVQAGDFAAPTNQAGGVVMMLNPGEPRAALAKQLLRHYAGKGGKKGGKKLTREDLGLDAATFARLDADEDGALDAEELARFDRRPADLELMVRLGDRRGAPAIEVVRREGRASPLAANVRRSAAGATALELGNTHLDLQAGGADDPNGAFFKVRIDQQYRAQFKAADRDGNGYLDEKEAAASPFFRGIFKAMDRDGDGKLFEKEMLAYLDKIKGLQEAAQKSFVSLNVSDQGRGLFDLLDANRDGRLGLREMRQMPGLVKRLDRDGDGAVSRPEVPRYYRADFRRGPVASAPSFGGRVFVVANRIGPSAPARPAPARGPVWFRKMDRNRDGDVSRREFLGTDAEFRKIDADGDGLISLDEAEKADELFRKAREAKR